MPAVVDDRAKVVTAGSGEPAILFVHGVACAGEDWQEQIKALSPNNRCMAIDLPGHGASPMPRENTIAVLAEAVVQAKKDSGAHEVVLVGHSMGARVIRQVYRVSPENVAGLIFVDSALFTGKIEDNIERMREQFRTVGYESYTKSSFGQMFLGNSDPALRERIVQRALRLDATLGQDLPQEIIRWDLTYGKSDMPGMKVPCLVIQSSYYNDEFKRAPIQEGFETPFMELARSIPDVQFRVVPGVGHFPMIEAADQVNKHIAEFVARLS